MRTKRTARPRQHPSRQILAITVCLFGISLLLLAISMVLKARPDAMLQAAGKGFGAPVPYTLLLGSCLLVIWWAIRPKPEQDAQSTMGPTLYDKDSMNPSQMDRPSALDERAP